MELKTAREIVREGVVLVTGEYLPNNFELVDTVIEPFCLYRVLLHKAVDLVIQDYFNNFPLHLRKIAYIKCTGHDGEVDEFSAPEGLERVLSLRDPNTKVLIQRIDDIEEFIKSKEPCYRYKFKGSIIECRNTASELELIYISKAVYGNKTYIHSEDCEINLDSNLVIFAFCKELCVTQSAPPNKVVYFNDKYINRLKYLIANEKCKENSVFDLSSKKDRVIRL